MTTILLTSPVTFAYQETALTDTYIINKFTKDDVLPTNTVTDIHLSQSGILYAASNEGLIIHDGFNWDLVNTENAPELLSERVLKIIETPYGQVFFQDQSNHLYVINVNQQVVIIRDPKSGEPIIVKAIDEQENWLTVVTDTKLLSIDRELTVRGEHHNAKGSIWDVEMIDSEIYVISSEGLYRFDESDESTLITDFEFVDVNYFARLEYLDNALLIFGNGGIECVAITIETNCEDYRFKGNPDEKVYHQKLNKDLFNVISSNQRLIQKSGSQIINIRNEEGLMYESILEEFTDNLLITSKGVWVDDNPIFIPTVEIVDATTDGKSIWLTSDQHGIIQIKPNYFTHFTWPGLVNSYSVVEKDESIWGGSFEFGFMEVEKNSELISTKNSALPNNTIRMMGALSTGDLIISNWGEKPVYFKNNEIINIPQLQELNWATTNVAEGIYEFENGEILIGTLEELYVMDEESVTAIKAPDGSSIEGVQRIVADPFTERVFLCTKQNGLYVYENGIVKPLFGENDPRHIRDIYFTSPNSFWVATYSSGLVRYILDENGVIKDRKQIDYNNRLPDTGFHKFLKIDDDELWVSSNDGLLQISLTALEAAARNGDALKTFKLFTEKDGLINREFNGGSQNTGLVDHNGNVWFTNQSGLVSFNPKNFLPEEVTNKNFYVRRISNERENEIWTSTDSVILSGWNNTFSIEFAHINTLKNSTSDIWYSVNNKSWQLSEKAGVTIPVKLRSGAATVDFALYPNKEPVYSLTLIRETPLVNQAWFRLVMGMLVLSTLIGWIVIKRNLKEAIQVSDEVEVEEKKSEVEIITECIHQNYQNPGFNLDDLSRKVKMSRSTMYRIWGKERDESLNAYLLSVRLLKAVELLVDEEKTITEAAEQSGFRSQSYFSKVFKKYYSLSPSKFLEKRNQVNL